jgi:DNA-binding FadR family transcriptional regulator
VANTANQLRDLILSTDPDTQIGSLTELAKRFSVGIVTVQQAARILEHEGLLQVKRGPGGGYYGVRPDDATLERIFASYLRVHRFHSREAFEMLLILDCEMLPAAAKGGDQQLRTSIAALLSRLQSCENAEDLLRFEKDLRDTLFQWTEKRFLGFLARVTMQLYILESKPLFSWDAEMIQSWRTSRLRILEAILQQDEKLTRFEAERYADEALSWLRSKPSSKKLAEKG